MEKLAAKKKEKHAYEHHDDNETGVNQKQTLMT